MTTIVAQPTVISIESAGTRTGKKLNRHDSRSLLPCPGAGKALRRSLGPESPPLPPRSLQGCIAVVEIVSGKRHFTINGVGIRVTGTLDLRGFEGVEEVSSHCQCVTGAVAVRASIVNAEFVGLGEETERPCPIDNLIKDAGVCSHIDWQLLP